MGLAFKHTVSIARAYQCYLQCHYYSVRRSLQKSSRPSPLTIIALLATLARRRPKPIARSLCEGRGRRAGCVLRFTTVHLGTLAAAACGIAVRAAACGVRLAEPLAGFAAVPWLTVLTEVRGAIHCSARCRARFVRYERRRSQPRQARRRTGRCATAPLRPRRDHCVRVRRPASPIADRRLYLQTEIRHIRCLEGEVVLVRVLF